MAIKFKEGLFGSELVSFEMIVCFSCHIPFMVTANHRASLLESGQTFYCPEGHTQHYTDSARSKKEKELEAKLKQTEKQLNDSYEYNNKIQRERWELQAALKEARKKDCPHCNKRFINLETHIKKQHG